MTEQTSLFGNRADAEYAAFVEKFKPKLTTDDCYTPPEVMDAVNGFVARRFGRDPATFVRPFFPGGDFENFDYPDGCVVVDNPPFSIYARIVRYYLARGIGFFLFSPTLTTFVYGADCCYYVAHATVVYENGACVNTSFVTNLDGENRVVVDAGLTRAVKEANERANKANKKRTRSVQYPAEVFSAAIVGKLCGRADFRIPKNECAYVRKLDCGQEIFGSGLLISERVAAERMAAERVAAERMAAERVAAERMAARERAVYELSEREREIVRGFGRWRNG